MKLAGQKLSLEQGLLALTVDGINTLCWLQSGKRSRSNRPKSLYKALTEVKVKDDYMVFDTPEEYMAYMAKKKARRKKWQRQ